MSSILRRTAQAEADLIAIWTYIANDNPAAADKLLDRLDERSRLLAQHPQLGARGEDIAPGLRHFPVGSYLILYRVVTGGIEVVRYVHGHRNLPDLF